MTVRELLTYLPAKVLSGSGELDRPISGGYASDLLSNVMGEAASGQIWVTMQAHQNIIAVASLVNLAAVIVAGHVEPNQQVVHKAEEQDVILLYTNLPVFETIGQMYALGIRTV